MLLSPSQGHKDFSAHRRLREGWPSEGTLAQRGKGDWPWPEGLERIPRLQTPVLPASRWTASYRQQWSPLRTPKMPTMTQTLARRPGGAYQCERRTFRSRMAAPRE